MDYATVSERGRRSTLEDTHVVIPNFHKRGCVFAAVYDGHRGSEVADYAASHLHNKHFLKEIKRGVPTKTAFRRAYLKTSMEAKRMVPDHLLCGSTAATAYLCGNNIVYAWAGDSRIVVVGNKKAVSLTTDHRPTTISKNEWERIKAAGGIMDDQGIWLKGYVLGVTRVLGDYSFQSVGATPDPETGSYRVKQGDRFLILACDGLWDVVDTEELPELIDKSKNAKEVAETLSCVALKQRGTTDNVTIVAVSLCSKGA